VEVRFTGGSLAVRLRTPPPAADEVARDRPGVAYRVAIDGREPSWVEVRPGEGRYALATGLDPSAVHEARFTREVEAFGGVHELLDVDLDPGASLLPPREPRRLALEVVGDSISCGYGVLGPDASCPFSYATERATAAYPFLVAESMDAELALICWSGRGVVRNYDGSGSGNGTMPELYERTLPESSAPFPFGEARMPDAVVVSLGTNDVLGGRGKPLDLDAFEERYVRFLARVRDLRPRVAVVVTTSPMLRPGPVRDRTLASLTRVVDRRRAAGDAHVELLDLEEQGSRVGCDAHPNAEMHRILARQVEAKLRPMLPGKPEVPRDRARGPVLDSSPR